MRTNSITLRKALSSAILGMMSAGGFLPVNADTVTEEWMAPYDGPPLIGRATAIAADADGNIIVTGRTENERDRITPAETDIYTAKYSGADGSLLWEQSYGSPSGRDGASAVAIDAAGNVAVTGAFATLLRTDFQTILYDGNDGHILWQARYGPPGVSWSFGRAIVVDVEGNVIVTGSATSIGDPQSQDVYTAKYAAADGQLIWQQLYDGPTHGEDHAEAAAVDPDGNVIVTGYSSDREAGHADIYTAKYAKANGALLWEATYDGADSREDRAAAIAVDDNGDVLVGGYSLTNENNTDFYTAKYSGENGELIWEQHYDGPGHGSDGVRALALDNAGNVVVTGFSVSKNYPSTGYYTAKYAANDGALLWEQRFDRANTKDQRFGDNVPHSLAIDPSGDVIVTGIQSNGSGKNFLHTIKYAGNDGWPIWETRRRTSGSPHPTQGIAMIGNGDFAIEGPDFTTIKYRDTPGPLHRELFVSGKPVPYAGEWSVPPGARWSSFESPAINDAGEVTFLGHWKSPSGSGSGVFVGGRLVAKVGQPAPGMRARFRTFRAPVINQDGRIAFLATVGADGFVMPYDKVVACDGLSPTTSGLQIIAREGMSSPVGDGSWWRSFANIAFAGSALDGSAGIVLEGTLTLGVGTPPVTAADDEIACIGVGSAPVVELVPAVREGRAVNGLASDELVKTWKLLHPSARTAGQSHALAVGSSPRFMASLNSGRQALLKSEGAAATAFLRPGDSLGSTTLPGAEWKSFKVLATATDGLGVLGTASTIGMGEVTGVFLGALNANQWEPIALADGEAPGLPGVSFERIDSLVLAPVTATGQGGLLFSATLTGTGVEPSTDGALWWQSAGGELELVAREGGEAPEANAARWKKFISLGLPGGETGPLILAEVAQPNGTGLWGVDPRNNLRLLFAQGSEIRGKTLDQFRVLSATRGSYGATRSFNNRGDVIWVGQFTNGTSALIRTTQR